MACLPLLLGPHHLVGDTPPHHFVITEPVTLVNSDCWTHYDDPNLPPISAKTIRTATYSPPAYLTLHCIDPNTPTYTATTDDRFSIYYTPYTPPYTPCTRLAYQNRHAKITITRTPYSGWLIYWQHTDPNTGHTANCYHRIYGSTLPDGYIYRWYNLNDPNYPNNGCIPRMQIAGYLNPIWRYDPDALTGDKTPRGPTDPNSWSYTDWYYYYKAHNWWDPNNTDPNYAIDDMIQRKKLRGIDPNTAHGRFFTTYHWPLFGDPNNPNTFYKTSDPNYAIIATPTIPRIPIRLGITPPPPADHFVQFDRITLPQRSVEGPFEPKYQLWYPSEVWSFILTKAITIKAILASLCLLWLIWGAARALWPH